MKAVPLAVQNIYSMLGPTVFFLKHLILVKEETGICTAAQCIDLQWSMYPLPIADNKFIPT